MGQVLRSRLSLIESDSILSKDNKYYLSLYPKDLEDLIGTICFVFNHEEYNIKWVKQLDQLAVYLEKFLDKK